MGCYSPSQPSKAAPAQQVAASRISVDSLCKMWFGRDRNETDTAMLSVGIRLQRYYGSNTPDSLPIISRDMEATGKMTGNKRWTAQGLSGLGNYFYNTGKPDSAMAIYRSAIQVLSGSDTALMCRIYLNMSSTFSNIDEPDSSRIYLLRTIPLAEQINSRALLSGAYGDLGANTQNEGNYLDAMTYLHKSLEYGNAYDSVITLLNLGIIFESLDLKEEAQINIREAIRVSELNPERDLRLYSYLAMMDIAPDMAELQTYMDKGLALCDSLNNAKLKLRLLTDGGRYYFNEGQLDKASKYLHEGLALVQEIKEDGPSLLTIQLQIAKLYNAQGNYQRSLQLCLEQEPLCRELGNADALITLTGVLSKNYEALGQPAKALQYLHEKNKLEEENNSNTQLKTVLSAYLKDKSKNEILSLQKEKAFAEASTRSAHEKARLSYWLFGSVSVFLSGLALFYYVFSRQKQQSAAQLAKINQTLQMEQQKLHRSIAKLRRFSGVVSHDILSNLDLILSTGNVLVGVQAKPERLSQYYNMTQQTSRQLKEYCIGLLQEARQTQDNLSEDQFDPMPSLQRVLDRYHTALTAAHFRIDIGILPPSPLPQVLAEQLFQNLISNALRHAGNVALPMLRIAAERDQQGEIIWVVEDNGPGIPESRRGAIFAGNTTQQQSGNGNQMGLSLLKQALEEFGTGIWVEDAQRGGARFVIKV